MRTRNDSHCGPEHTVCSSAATQPATSAESAATAESALAAKSTAAAEPPSAAELWQRAD